MKAAFILLLTLFLCAGCEKAAVPPAKFQSQGTKAGITWDVRADDALTTNATDESVKISSSKWVLEIDIVTHKLRVNGKSHGPVKKNDKVVMTADGRVSV